MNSKVHTLASVAALVGLAAGALAPSTSLAWVAAGRGYAGHTTVAAGGYHGGAYGYHGAAYGYHGVAAVGAYGYHPPVAAVGVYHPAYGYGYPAGAVAGAAVAGAVVGAAVAGSRVYALPPSCALSPYGGINYYGCGGVWYRPAYEGDTVVYTVVARPY
jgi:hypothetical protein